MPKNIKSHIEYLIKITHLQKYLTIVENETFLNLEENSNNVNISQIYRFHEADEGVNDISHPFIVKPGVKRRNRVWHKVYESKAENLKDWAHVNNGLLHEHKT